MCGFAGYAGEEFPETNTAQVLGRMGRYLAARGPDDETTFERRNFRLVFRRLAINDVEGGRQPFLSDDQRFVVVVNGEIYNHRDLRTQYLSDVTFVTHSDCEVVLHLFRKLGPGFLSQLNGIYSIAIWDQKDRVLFLARDRLGVKPLYYTIVGETFFFASELKALLVHPAVPRTIDWEAVRHVPNPVFPFERTAGRPVPTGIKGISFLEPATYVKWQDGKIRAECKYWKPAGPAESIDAADSPGQYIEQYEHLIADSIRMQLMSDVPVGLFLSGGLDSSLIAAIASQEKAGLQAYTLVEPSITKTGDTDAAVELARDLDMPLHLVRVDEEALRATLPLSLETLEYFVWIMDFPLFDVEILFKHELHRYAKSTNPEMKVVLLGQGADEFAGGYSAVGAGDWETSVDMEAESLHTSLLAELGISPIYAPYVGRAITRELATRRTGEYEPWQWLRFSDLPAFNLWHEDRTAAANGTEARVPFLDHRLVEFLCSIPRRWHEDLFFNKNIERRAARRFLPDKYVNRPKVPLFIPERGFDQSVLNLRRALLDSSFEEFREKYLDAGDALLSKRQVLALREETEKVRGRHKALDLLLRCMAISIFDKSCRELALEAFKPPQLNSTLPPLTANTAVAPAQVVTKGGRIVLAESIRLAWSVDAPPRLLVIEDDAISAEISLPQLRHSGTNSNELLRGREIDFGKLADDLGLDPESVMDIAAAFENRGWGRRVDGAAQPPYDSTLASEELKADAAEWLPEVQ